MIWFLFGFLIFIVLVAIVLFVYLAFQLNSEDEPVEYYKSGYPRPGKFSGPKSRPIVKHIVVHR